jgi:hypothetical protein
MKAIYTRLTYDAGSGTNPLRTAVSDRIYAIEAPARTTLPLVVYSIDSVDTERFFGGVVREIGSFTVSAFAKSESGADSIVDTEKTRVRSTRSARRHGDEPRSRLYSQPLARRTGTRRRSVPG